MTNAPIYSNLLDDEPDLEPIVNRFVNRLPDVLGALQHAYGVKNWAELSHVAHELKGTSGNLGFPQVMRIADQIESRAKKTNDSGLDALLADLEELCQRVASRAVD